MRLLLSCLFGGLFVMSAGAVQAQLAQNLQVELSPTSPPVRLNRPMLTLWTLRSQVEPVVEGRLLLELAEGQQSLGSHIIDDVVLTSSMQRLTLLLPPVSSDAPLDEIEVKVRFETRGQVLELQPQILRVPTARQEALMVLVGEAESTGSRPRRRDLLLGKTQFEAFAPETEEPLYQTVLSTLRPQDFPQTAAAYCGFDGVYLVADALALLRGPQLDSLRQWVQAGGSLYVDLPLVIEGPQLKFLKALGGEAAEPLVWQLTPQGRLDFDALPAAALLSLRCGLGHVLIRINDGEPREDPLDSPEFRRGFAEFWRLPAPRVEAVVERGNWDLVLRARQRSDGQDLTRYQASVQQIMSRGQAAQQLSHQIAEYLKPRDLRLIPFWLIACMLSGLVIWIGPVEYVLLGRLRLRKWTWVTFPVAVLAMTAVTVWLANRAMAGVENGHSLQMFDYAEQGDLVRSHEFDLRIPAVSGVQTREIRDGLYSNVSGSTGFLQRVTVMTIVNGRQVPRQMLLNARTGQVVNAGFGGAGYDAESPLRTTIVGRAPKKYAVQQTVKQWTPCLSRTFSLPGQAPIAGLDWSAIDVPRLLSGDALSRPTLPPELTQVVRQVFGPDAWTAVMLPRRALLTDGRNEPLSVGSSSAVRIASNPRWPNYQPETPAQSWREFLIGATLRPPSSELLSVVRGPQGGGALEDLPLIDSSDQRLVLIVAVPRGRTVEVYRKVYPLPGDKPAAGL